MDIYLNPFAGEHSAIPALKDIPWPSQDAARPIALLRRCPSTGETPLVSAPSLAATAQIAQLSIKDERARMGLGSFKALGAAYVIARDAEAGTAQGRTYVTASAGNHGLSVAAGAAAFKAKSIIYLSQTVPESFAERLRRIGAEVVREGEIYEDSMQAAATAADTNGWALLSDSSWPGYVERPHVLMEGYLTLMAEAVAQIETEPTHIFLQAGVGGLAAACATYARKIWHHAPKIVVVEPEVAPALIDSLKAGRPLLTEGPVSNMGRLDCKEPSLIALKGLARDADAFVTLSEAEGEDGALRCAQAGFPSTPSGAAGIAALLASGPHRQALGLSETSHALVILSEESAA